MYSITVSTRGWWMHEARSTEERGGRRGTRNDGGQRDGTTTATGCLPPLPSQSLQTRLGREASFYFYFSLLSGTWIPRWARWFVCERCRAVACAPRGVLGCDGVSVTVVCAFVWVFSF